MKGCTFTKKCDVFAGGIIMMELVLMRSAKNLYTDFWPKILDMTTLPDKETTAQFLRQTLDTQPGKRSGFEELHHLLLTGESSTFMN